MFHELAFVAMNKVTLLLVIYIYIYISYIYIYIVNDLPYQHLSTATITAKRTEDQFPGSVLVSCWLHPMEQRSLRGKRPWRDGGAAGRPEHHSGWCPRKWEKTWRNDDSVDKTIVSKYIISSLLV